MNNIIVICIYIYMNGCTAYFCCLSTWSVFADMLQHLAIHVSLGIPWTSATSFSGNISNLVASVAEVSHFHSLSKLSFRSSASGGGNWRREGLKGLRHLCLSPNSNSDLDLSWDMRNLQDVLYIYIINSGCLSWSLRLQRGTWTT